MMTSVVAARFDNNPGADVDDVARAQEDHSAWDYDSNRRRRRRDVVEVDKHSVVGSLLHFAFGLI